MDKTRESFCEDICNIARVLPNLAPSVIYEELNNLIDESDRVQIVLKKYFASYEEHNCLTDDIKKIKRVVPNYPFVQINTDLLSVEGKENRVQLVLRKYFDGESKAAKRALVLEEIDLTEDSPSKKFKSDTDAIEKIIPEEKEQSSNETESYSFEIPSKEDELTVEETKNVQEEKTETGMDQLLLDNSCVIVAEDKEDELTVEETKNVQEEKTETGMDQLLLDNSCVIVAEDKADDKNSNESEKCSSQNSDQINTQTSTETENILSVLSNIFPQYSSEILGTVCQDLGIDIYGSPNESTLQIVVSVLFNQVKKEEIFKRSKSEGCDGQPVSTCSVGSSENSSNSATQEFSDDKKFIGECNVVDFGPEFGMRKDFSGCEDLISFSPAVDRKNPDESNNSVQTSSINNGPAPTINIPSENIIEEVVSDINFDPNLKENTLFKSKINENPSSVDNIIAELNSTNIISTRPAEQIASTSNYLNHLEYDTAINNLIQEYKDSVQGSIAAVLNSSPNLEPTPSTSKFYDNPEPSTSNIDFYSGLSTLALSTPTTSALSSPSASSNIPDTSISKFSTAESLISSSSENDVFNNKLENELRNSNHTLESNQNSVINTNSNILDFETAFFNNININNTDNMATSSGGRVTSTIPKTVRVQSNSIIRPAILRSNTSNTVTAKNIAVHSKSDMTGTRKISIIKTASFKPVAQNAGNYKTANAATSTILARTTNPAFKNDPDLNKTPTRTNLLKSNSNPKIIVDKPVPSCSDLNKTRASTRTKSLKSNINSKIIAEPVPSGSGINNTRKSPRIKSLKSNTSPIIIADDPVPSGSGINNTRTSPRIKSLKSNTSPIIISDEPVPSGSGLRTRSSTRTKSLISNTNPKIIVDQSVPGCSGLKRTRSSTKINSLKSKTNPKIIVDEQIPGCSGLNKTVKSKKTSTTTSNNTKILIEAKAGSSRNPQVIIAKSSIPSATNQDINADQPVENRTKTVSNIHTNITSNNNPKRTNISTNTTEKNNEEINNNKLIVYHRLTTRPLNPTTSKFASNSTILKSAANLSTLKPANPGVSKFATQPGTSKCAAIPGMSKSADNPSTSTSAANPGTSKFASHTITSKDATSSKRENSVQGSSKIKSQSLTNSKNVFHIANNPNKKIIRVRTDLYDAYFNGPITPSSKLKININKEPKNKNDNDDIIFISADPIPVHKLTLIDKVIKPKQEPAEIIIPKKEETTTVNENVNIIADRDQPSTSKATENHPFYYKLLEIFPDICPVYLKKFCAEKTANATIDDLISVLLNEDYRKRDRPESPESHLVFEEQHKILQDLFPDADPTYLQHHCERLIDQPDAFEQFVTSLVENKTYPTKAEYLKKMKLSAQEKQYTTEFDVKKFLEVIPNPEEFFNDPKRQISYNDFDDTNYAVTFLKNRFCSAAIKDITHIFRKSKFSVLRSANALESLQNLKSKRKPYPVTSCTNIPLLQEIAYVKHRKEIELYLKEQKLEKVLLRKQAKESGLVKTCQCCYDDEIMPDEVASCEDGAHIFCKECVRRGCEVVIGDGKLDFPCLETCNSKFSLQVLQAVLTPKVFSKMAQRKQMEEVKSAGIEDLEFCPFCDFATIPEPSDKLFRCLNDDCMKESCRSCKEPSHIPLRCNEVEKDKDVKVRTYIENKMTEALLRKCYKCGLKFIKESGCNKMTCSCGARMCYVCNQPVQDYKHFNGQGGDQTHLCPLYSDTHKLHADAIKKSAENAKKEMGVDKENALKIDPTVDIDHHYRRLAAQNPAIPNVPVVFPANINLRP